MADIPPWLDIRPSDFVKAASMGAEAGARAAAQRAESRQAADRLGLAYAQLASEERRASERAAAQMEITAMKTAMQAQAQDAALALREQQMANLAGYREARLGQFGEEEARRREAMSSQEARAAASLEERTRHNLATESISADRAQALINRGAAQPITFPEFPGMTFIKQPSGAILKVEATPRPPTVVVDEEGKPKSYTGRITDPAMLQIMGTNAPAFLQPGGGPPPAPAQPSVFKRAFDYLTGGGTPPLPNWPGTTSAVSPLEPPTGASSFPPATASQTAAPPSKTEGRYFRDSSGKLWIYTGTAEDPKTDKNPDNWVEQ